MHRTNLSSYVMKEVAEHFNKWEVRGKKKYLR